MHTLWTSLFYQPIYNILVFVINTITFGDVGFAIIVVTIFIKFILFPLTRKSIKSQVLMKRIEPELKAIKKDYPNKEEQAKKTFELYKKYDVNPFSGCLVVLLQLPVIFALYYVFSKGLTLDTGPLYSFMHMNTTPHTLFLGLFDIHGKSFVLAFLAGLAQFVQGYLAMPLSPKIAVVDGKDAEPKTFQEQLADSMQMNVRYILPVFVVFIAYKISAAVALYWITSTVFTIVQEWYIRKSLSTNTKA